MLQKLTATDAHGIRGAAAAAFSMVSLGTLGSLCGASVSLVEIAVSALLAGIFGGMAMHLLMKTAA